MPGHQPAVGHQLMDHLVGRQAQVARPPIQVQERRPVGHLPLQPLDQRPALGPADPSRRLVPQLQPQSPPRRHLLEQARIAPQLVPAPRQRRPRRPLLLAAPRIAGDHRVPRRVEVAAGRRERVGTLPVQERQVILPVREPRRDQPVAGHPQLHALGGEEQVETRDRPAPGRPPAPAASASLCWCSSRTCGPRAILASIPSAARKAAKSGSGQGRSSPSSTAAIRAVGPCFGSIACSARTSAAASVVRPFSIAHQAAAYRDANPASCASRRRPSHSSAGQKPGTRFTTSSRSSSSFPPGRSSTRRPSSTVAGSCASPPPRK